MPASIFPLTRELSRVCKRKGIQEVSVEVRNGIAFSFAFLRENVLTAVVIRPMESVTKTTLSNVADFVESNQKVVFVLLTGVKLYIKVIKNEDDLVEVYNVSQGKGTDDLQLHVVEDGIAEILSSGESK